MDPAAIATAVVAFLAPYLAEGGKAVAKKAGEALWAALERRFGGQPAAQEALADMQAHPHEADFQAALRVQLVKALEADTDFLAEVVRLLEEAKAQAAAPTYHATVQGPGAIAQGPGAVAAGARGVAIGGDVEGSVIVTGDDSTVQTGGIRARRIKATNVVEGVLAQGVQPEDAGKLVRLAKAIQRGGITADEIEAESVVSGLHFAGGAPPVSAGELRREVAALREQVERAIAAGEIAKPGDAEDARDALAGAERELSNPRPDGGRVVRKLEAAAKILTPIATMAEAAGKVTVSIIKLAPLAAALWKLAERILGG